MFQIIQNQKTGKIEVTEVPRSRVSEGYVLVRNHWSLISAGTERTSVETAQASMIGKAKARPDLVRQVLANARREGLMATYKKVQSRLDSIKELGYSSAGVVVESKVPSFAVGDRVACAGAGYAFHAEVVCVPKNLVAKVPAAVSLDEAAFATVAAIALQGIRQADVRVGERVAVIGLGLIGLMTVQMLKASGCRVIGLDVSPSNFPLAKQLGCDVCVGSNAKAVRAVESFTNGGGTDAVIITAGTKSNEPLELSLEFARKRSKVVVVGAVNMNVPRSPFYEKELDLRIACSYGPGRYDPSYEEEGHDYPIGYVRWTENRNMEAVLDLMAQKKLDVKSLVTHRIPIQEGVRAYDIITGKIKERYLGVLLEYPTDLQPETNPFRVNLQPSTSSKPATSSPVIGFIGAGNFAQSYLLPPLKALGANLKGVVASSPVNARSVAAKFGMSFCASDADELLNDQQVNTIFVATRHDSHAEYVVRSLAKGKNVYVEKPLALSVTELDRVRKTYGDAAKRGQSLMVGFNRRFSKPFGDIQSFFQGRNGPFFITYRINAGFIPKQNWVQAPEQGGRILGEVCHFVDTASFLIGADPIQVYAASIDSANKAQTNEDTLTITLRYPDGSVANIIYLANGDTAVEKEYCEVTADQKSAIMRNFQSVEFFENGRKRRSKYDGTKGHKEEVTAFVGSVSSGSSAPIPFESLYATTLSTFKIVEALRKRKPLDL